VQLRWRKCAGDAWCRFEDAVLPDPNASGILLVWSGSVTPHEHVLYIAQGGIAKNLRWARQFEPIAKLERLYVTWAAVPEDSQNGVHNYLSQRLSAVHDDRRSSDTPIPVNLPWESAVSC
jgi:hypothetical protein